MSRHPRDPRGFSFLELIACLAVITLAAAFLFPVYLQARASARRTNCASNLQQVGAALHLYAHDHDGRFPPDEHGWATSLQTYSKNWGVYACPAEPDASLGKFGVGAAAGAGGALFSSYQYRPGFANDDTAGVPIAQDWEPWHLGGLNRLHLGGDVRWVAAREARPLTASPRRAAPAGTAAPAPPIPIFGGN